MKKEFNYWYPLDIRVSGKDLISNHLTMSLFNHQAIWEGNLPRSYFVNGYLLLNGQKMSKHTGNFMTIKDAINKFGSTAARFALANNDGIEDGNFESSLAESIVLKLTAEFDWIQSNVPSGQTFTQESPDLNIWDKIFDHEITSAVTTAKTAYENTKYHTVVKCFYALLSARDEYIKNISACGITQNSIIIRKYSRAVITVLYPICPSFVMELMSITGETPNWHITSISSDGSKYKFYKDVICEVTGECNKVIEKAKKNGKKFYFDIVVFSQFSEDEKEIISNIGRFDEFMQTVDKKKFGAYKGFMSHIKKQTEIYGSDWIHWVNSKSNEEYDILSTYVPKIITSHKINFSLAEPDEKFKFKNNPGNPKVSTKFVTA
jgi:leucyl-tRNA synthetase